MNRRSFLIAALAAPFATRQASFVTPALPKLAGVVHAPGFGVVGAFGGGATSFVLASARK